MWSVKKIDFARDDNNELSSNNQKLLIFHKQTLKELYTLSGIPGDDEMIILYLQNYSKYLLE